jgi:hypothetical protein
VGNSSSTGLVLYWINALSRNGSTVETVLLVGNECTPSFKREAGEMDTVYVCKGLFCSDNVRFSHACEILYETFSNALANNIVIFYRPGISLSIKIVTSIDVSPCFHGLKLRALVLLESR